MTNNVTYNAIFEEVINKYTISFYDEDGVTLLDKVTVNYGENVVYPKNNPIKNATDSHTFSFDKWVTTKNGIIEDDLSDVIKDRNAYASYKATVRKVNIYILSNNSYGVLSLSFLNDIDYGTEIRAINNKLYIDSNIIEANPLESNAQYTYEFGN